MEVPQDSVRSLFLLFRKGLKELYPEKETDQILSLLFDAWLGWSKAKIHMEMDSVIPSSISEKIKHALEEMKTGKPVQYIIGTVLFAGVHLKVSPGVLIPRPETEELVEWIYRDHQHLQYRDFSLLDIGTGSGCIPVSLKHRFHELLATGIDQSDIALTIAEENATLNLVTIVFLQEDILNRSSWKRFGTFDIIVSNPPYVPEKEKDQMSVNVLGFEPPAALFVSDEDPLIFYREIAAFGLLHLTRPGFLYFEIHADYGSEIRELLHSSGYEKVIVRKDFHGKDRFVRAELGLSMADQSYWHVEH